jgi:YD repeat-containing protein
VAAGTADGSVSIWNAKDGALLKSSPLEEGAIEKVLLVAERLVVLTAAGRLHVLSLPGLSEAAPARPANGLLVADRFGRYVLAGQRGATMVLNLQDNKLDRVLTSVTDPFKQVSISPDGRLVAGLSADGSFVLFDPVNDVKMLNLSKAINSRSSVISIAFVDDQRLELLHEDGSAGEIQLDGEPLPIWRDTLLRGAVALAPLRGDISTAVAVRLDGDRIVTNGLDWLSMANFACDIGGWQSSTTGTEAESTALNICEDRIKPASAAFGRPARTAAPAADLLAQFADFQGAAAVLGNAESLKVFPATLPPDAAPDAARGYRLEFGPPAERNRQEALKAYRAAALANDPFALSRLAILLIDNDDPSLAAEAHQALARAVQLNFPLAVDVQAQAAELGLGEPENDQRARDLFKKAIDLGERTRSPRNLARLLQQSAKSPEDWDEVARYFRIAVQAGDGRAADDLAKLIEPGSIQPKDGAELASLLKLASEYSAHGALRYALELDRQARSDPAAAALADKYRWSAAKAGDGDGLFQVGHKMAQSSKPEDRHIAAALFVNSRRAGHLAAASALADLLADEGAGNAEVRHWFRVGGNPDSSSMMTVPERQISPSELVANTTKMAAISSSDIRYGFDRDGHQISVRSPNGTAELRWDQKLGTVAAVSVELQKGTHAEYSYVKNDLGALTSVRKAGEDILHLEYDKDGRLTRVAETGEGGNRLRLTYSKEAEQTWISMEAVSEYSLRCRFDNYASFIGAQNVSYFQFSDCGSLHDARTDAIAKSVDALLDIIEPQRQIDPNAQLLNDPGKLLFSIRRFIRTNG